MAALSHGALHCWVPTHVHCSMHPLAHEMPVGSLNSAVMFWRSVVPLATCQYLRAATRQGRAQCMRSRWHVTCALPSLAPRTHFLLIWLESPSARSSVCSGLSKHA